MPGCLLAVALLEAPPAGAQAIGAASPPPTFTHDVAPLVYEHCGRCHRPGGSAPFSLLTYADLRPRARQVVAAVRGRMMPPWRPAGERGEFEGDPRLADTQIQIFERWLDAGAEKGADADLPPPPTWSDEWELGAPDLVVPLDEPYTVAPGGPDQLRNFVVSLPVTTTRYVRAWEFRTTNTRVVHHATLMVDRGGEARRLDAQDPASGYEGLIPLSASSPEGYFLGWTPGQRAFRSRPDLAWRLDPGNDLIVMLHLRPGEQPEPVDARVALYFSDGPPSHLPVMIRLNRQDLDIPAGEAHFAATDAYTLPVDVDLHAIQPHAHYLAREIRVTATLPDGRTRRLLGIPSWDFHWQDVYRFRTSVHLPAGTRLSMTFTYDNSSANRDNPRRPPVRVIWGQRSSDEMGDVWMQVVATRDADRARLVADLRRTLVPKDIDGYRKMLEADPGNPALHDDLALLAMESGDAPLALSEFRAVLDRRPDAAAHYNVGNVLLDLNRPSEAADQFTAALRLDASYGLAQQGFGLALRALGRTDDAAAALERAATLLPSSGTARYNLGVVRQQQGHFAAALEAYDAAVGLDPGQADARYAAALIRGAVGESGAAVSLFREALAIRPGWPEARKELAWVLATAPADGVRRPAEALALARDAAAHQPSDARAADVLGVALAASGAFEPAAEAARRALRLLPASAEPALRAAIAQRLDLYGRGLPFRLDVRR